MDEKKILEEIASFLKERKEKEIFNEIEEFHKKRKKKIKNNDTPRLLSNNAKIVFHLIPVESYRHQKYYDLSVCEDKPGILSPLRFSGYTHTYNFDGLFNFHPIDDEKCVGYVQLYSNGTVEAVNGLFLESNKKKLYIRDIEDEIINKTKEYLLFQEEFGIEPPIIFHLMLLGVKGVEMAKTGYRIYKASHPIYEEDLDLPKLFIDKFDIELEKILKTSFDQIWNACGYPKSEYYDDRGRRKEKQ